MKEKKTLNSVYRGEAGHCEVMEKQLGFPVGSSVLFRELRGERAGSLGM